MKTANAPITDKIDLRGLGRKGVKVLGDYAGKPNKSGVLKRYELVVPPFRRGCYFTGDRPLSWPNAANRILPYIFGQTFKRLRYGGLFALIELKTGDWLALTPMAGPLTMTWFNVSSDGRLALNFGTLGTAPAACDAPLLAWSRSDDLYTACRESWAEAVACKPAAGSTRFRKDKHYPDIFRYLGWCSWEEYKGAIGETVLTGAVRQIEASGLPVRYALIDDGHVQSDANRRIESFKPNAKFPNGWAPILNLRKRDKIRWMGLWQNFNGYWNSISPENDFGPELNAQLAALPSGAIMPRNDPKAARAFYDAYLGSVRRNGFDFIKIDNQARGLSFYIGSGNAVQAATACSRALETAAKHEFNSALINCMAHNSVCVFNTRHSAVTRCSIDYKIDVQKGKSHIWQSYNNTLWLCQTVWGDHDMFHSCDPDAGRMMAISKAMSGGPVYLSDDPKHLVAEYIRPLCYENGELLRPLAPAAPLPDSAAIDPMKKSIAYRAVAPLNGGAAAIAAYNLRHPTPKTPIGTSVTANDYAHAGGMIQPYKGQWKAPAEGLVVYDWHAGTAERLEKEYAFKLRGFSDRLLHLCPIKKGWALVGRTDKYLSPAAVEVLSRSKTKIVVRLIESGPFAVWRETGAVSAEGVEFQNAGGGLWRADLPVGKRNVILVLWRK